MCNYADSDRLRVISAIEAAFADVRLEDGVSLHEADAIDNYADSEQRANARAVDTATDWRDVPHSELESMIWVWSFFDAKGFRFHLPAGMVWSLHAVTDTQADLTAVEFLIGALSLGVCQDSLFHEHVRLLSSDQIAAVRQFLQWFVDYSEGFHDDACDALTAYWNDQTKS